MRRIHFKILQALLIAVTLFWVVACNAEQISNYPSHHLELRSPLSTHRVEHGMGTTYVPTHPSRIITLDESTLECVLALQLKPVASIIFENTPPYFQNRIEGIENLGSEGEPSLEKILALKPDLILGTMLHEQIYAQLSRVAPTVLTPYQASKDWKAALLHFADALGQTAAAEQILQDYTARLDTFKAQMGDRLQDTQVSVVRVYPTHLSLYLKDVFIGTILQDAGLPRPPAQDKLGAANAVSKERIHEADGDVIFVWTYGYSRQRQQEAEDDLVALKSNPLWSRLKAVQRAKAYVVPAYWIGSGPLAANAVVDDLFHYLIGDKHQ